MSQGKKRGALFVASCLIVDVAVAVFLAAEAWVVAPGLAVVLAIHLGSPIDDDPSVPNHPLKLWLYVIVACCGLVLMVLGFTSKTDYWLIGAFLLVLSLPSIWVIRQGRNPWWVRGGADYRRR
jgi:hypothetical protein